MQSPPKPTAPDVFFCYNRAERDAVLAVAQPLEDRGVKIWIDRDVEPGLSFRAEIAAAIQRARVAVIFIGAHGVGAFQTNEIDACDAEALHRGLRVVPVLLPDGKEHVPLLLRNRQWLDMSGGVDDEVIGRLERAITGAMAVETATRMIEIKTRNELARELDRQYVDPLGIALRKGRLRAISEVVADAAAEAAAAGARTYDNDGLSVFVPLLVSMRWRRGWGAAVETLLKVPASQRFVRDYRCASVETCAVSEGVLRASVGSDGAVVISLDGHPAVIVTQLDPARRAAIVESVNAYGRLGASSGTLLERIGDIPIRNAEDDDADARLLYDAREALVPILARLRNPGDEWLWGEQDAGETADRSEEPYRVDAALRDLRDRARRASADEPDVFRAMREVRHSHSDRELLLLPAVRTIFGDLVDRDPEKVLEYLRNLAPNGRV